MARRKCGKSVPWLHKAIYIGITIGIFFFFFQAEDGIRDLYVTGVQTCALPICLGRRFLRRAHMATQTMSKDDILEAIGNMSVSDLAELIEAFKEKFGVTISAPEIGRASCRERV